MKFIISMVNTSYKDLAKHNSIDLFDYSDNNEDNTCKDIMVSKVDNNINLMVDNIVC